MLLNELVVLSVTPLTLALLFLVRNVTGSSPGLYLIFFISTIYLLSVY